MSAWCLATALRFLTHSIPEVTWVEERTQRRLQMADAAWMVQSGAQGTPTKATPLWDAGLRGEGEVVTVGDSGVDINHCSFADPSEPVPYGPGAKNLRHRKIVAYNDEFTHDRLDEAGHGSRCGGIVAGSPASEAASPDASGVPPNNPCVCFPRLVPGIGRPLVVAARYRGVSQVIWLQSIAVGLRRSAKCLPRPARRSMSWTRSWGS